MDTLLRESSNMSSPSYRTFCAAQVGRRKPLMMPGKLEEEREEERGEEEVCLQWRSSAADRKIGPHVLVWKEGRKPTDLLLNEGKEES